MGIIDFQWTGLGLCATDVAYCVAASACASAVFKDPSQYDAFRSACEGRTAAPVNPQASSSNTSSSGWAAPAAGRAYHNVLDRDDLDDDEGHLLRAYHSALVAALAESRDGGSGAAPAPAAPTFEVFVRQYRLAFLDYCRVSVGCFWDVPGNRRGCIAGDAPPGAMPLGAMPGAPTIVELLRARQRERSLLYNAANKSLEVMCWMLRRMRAYLAELEDTAKG